MQSTGHSSMQALSLRSTQGCAITYVTTVLLMSGRSPVLPTSCDRFVQGAVQAPGRFKSPSPAMSPRTCGSLTTMGRIVMPVSVSIDGFHEDADGGLSWQIIDEELHEHFNTELARMSAFLDGRVSYELMVRYWPTADEDPANPPAVAAFAGIWRDMPKVVYSRTLADASWNSRIERE